MARFYASILVLLALLSLGCSWRQVLPGNLRHIAVAFSSDRGQTFTAPVIVSDDQWMLAGCPVSGSSLAVSKDGTLHLLWYSAGSAGPTGVYIAESQDQGRSFGPRRLVAEGLAQGTPVLLQLPNGSQAIWQSGQALEARVITAPVEFKTSTDANVIAEASSQLPAASLVGKQILIACIRQSTDDRRSIWLTKVLTRD